MPEHLLGPKPTAALPQKEKKSEEHAETEKKAEKSSKKAKKHDKANA